MRRLAPNIIHETRPRPNISGSPCGQKRDRSGRSGLLSRSIKHQTAQRARRTLYEINKSLRRLFLSSNPVASISSCSAKILAEEQKPNYNRTQTRAAWLHSRANKLFLLAQNTQTKVGERSSDFKHRLYGKRLAEFKILRLCNIRLCLPLKKPSTLPVS